MDERKCVSETNKQTKQQHFSTGAPRQLCIRLPGSCLVGTTRVTYMHTWVMRRSCLNASRQQQPAAGWLIRGHHPSGHVPPCVGDF